MLNSFSKLVSIELMSQYLQGVLSICYMYVSENQVCKFYIRPTKLKITILMVMKVYVLPNVVTWLTCLPVSALMTRSEK